MRTYLAFAATLIAAHPAAAQSTWDVGRRPGEDATRALYVFEGNAGDAPVLRVDCASGGRLRISHVMESRIRLNRIPNLELNISAGSDSVQLAARSELDEMTGLNIVSHMSRPDSTFIRLLRANVGQMRITASGGGAKSISIDLTGNRSKVDQALMLCRKAG
jgi:hypothetical protein